MRRCLRRLVRRRRSGLRLAAAADAYYERAVMDDADQRCKLFPPEMGSALEAAEAQARGAALRSGADQAALNAVARRASAKVAAVSCASPDIATAAARVRTAFAGYSKLQRMNYPGDLADWTADRSTSRQAPIWKLWQREDVRQGRVVFGLAGKDGPSNLIVTASFADGAAPYAAQLVMRDVNFAPEPFLNSIQASASGHMPLSARMPPQSGTRLFMAEARGQGDPSLLPLGARSGVVFRFPKAAARVFGPARSARGGGDRVSGPFAGWRRRDAHGLCRSRRLRGGLGVPGSRSALRLEGDHFGASDLRSGRRARLAGSQNRQAHADRGSLAEAALDGHLPAVQLGECAHQR